MRQVCLLVLCISFISLAKGIPQIYLSTHAGSTLSFVNADPPSGVNVDGHSIIAYPCFGLGLDVAPNPYFRVFTGAFYEARGGILSGNISWYNIIVVSGDIRFQYRYIQIPLGVKAVIPLLIPGNIVISAAPELGINLEGRIEAVRDDTTYMGDLSNKTKPLDFGFTGDLGYDIPLGWNTGFMVHASFYLGVVDIYEDKNSSNDWDLLNRSTKLWLSYYVNLTAEKP